MDNLIIKYLAGETSSEESKAVEHWKAENPGEFRKWKEAYDFDIFENVDFNAPDLPRLRTSSRKYSYAIAASLVLLLGVAWFFHQHQKEVAGKRITIANTGQSGLKYELPDGTSITLKKGASISYSNDFQRDITLQGTAFLKVHKDPSHPFVVHTGLSTVRVLGTQFLIQALPGGQSIILKEGIVEVCNHQNEKKVLRHYGDELRIDDNGDFASFGKANFKLYLSWTSTKIDFNHCSVEEVLQYLGDTYGIKYQVKDSAFLHTELVGSAPAHNPELVIRAIAGITKKKVITSDHQFIFE